MTNQPSLTVFFAWTDVPIIPAMLRAAKAVLGPLGFLGLSVPVTSVMA